LLPIIIHYDQYSLYPTNWDGGQYNPGQTPAGDPVNRFPDGVSPQQKFDYPSPAPKYLNQVSAPQLRTETYSNNQPGVWLPNLRKRQAGGLYFAREGSGPGSFGWLSWRPEESGGQSQGALVGSLQFPGNFLDKYPGSQLDMNLAYGNQNGVLEVGEWIATSTGNVSSASGNINEAYIDNGTPVMLIVYHNATGTGSNLRYQVHSFVKARLVGYSFSGSNKWILFQFLDWTDSCEEP
jgi:hypothetical protein